MGLSHRPENPGNNQQNKSVVGPGSSEGNEETDKCAKMEPNAPSFDRTSPQSILLYLSKKAHLPIGFEETPKILGKNSL